MWHDKPKADALPNYLISGVDQVCTVVKDFEGTVKLLSEKLGIGPFKCWDVKPPALFERTFRGSTDAKWTMRLGVALVGKTQWEVIQPMEGDSLYHEHLKSFGEGVHHLLLETTGTPYENSVQRFEAEGFPHAQTAALNLPLLVGGLTFPAAPKFLAPFVSTRFGYVDTLQTLKTTLELAKFPPGVSRPLGIRLGKAEFFRPESETNVESSLGNSIFDKVVKLGFIVRDAEATARAWAQKAGVGPWHVVEFGPEQLKDVKMVGSKDFKGRIAWALVGNFLFELVQPLAGDTPHARALAAKGEGIHSVGMKSDVLDFTDARAAMEAVGAPTLVEGVLHGGYEFALFNTTKLAGTCIELVRLDAAPLFEELKKLPGKKIS